MAIQSLQQLRNKISGRPDTSDEGQDEQEHPLISALSKIPKYATDAAGDLPENLWNMISQVPGAAMKTIAHPIDASRDLLGGVARGSQKLASAGLEGGEYLTRKGAEGLLHATGQKDAKVPKWNAREFMGLEGNRPIDLGGMIESDNPNALLSGVGQYGLGASSLGSKIPAIIGASAMTGAIQANPGQRIKGATEGAVNAALPIAGGKAIAKTYNTLKPSNLLRGNLSNEELLANLKAAEGTNTGLGDVIGSPTLKRVQENILPSVPFSGAYTAMQNTARQITEKGEGLMSKIGENLPEGDKTKILQDAIKSAARQATKDKQADYKKVNKIADDLGLSVGRAKFQSKAQSILDNIEKSPELKREFPSDLLADIKEYASNGKGNSLELSNIFKGKLGSKANKHYREGNTHEYGIMKDLHEALDSDIKSAIKDSGHDTLMAEYKNAQANYGSKYKPFEHPDVAKFTKEGGDADTMLSHFLKTGVNDRGELIERLTTKLPKNLRNLPLHMYLSRAVEDGKLNPVKLDTLYGKLGEKQRSALIPEKAMRDQLENYTRGVGMNKESFHTMFNPKTGQRNLDSLIGALEAAAGYGLAGLKGAAVALPVGGIAGRIANKALTSERARTKLVKAMLKQKAKK